MVIPGDSDTNEATIANQLIEKQKWTGTSKNQEILSNGWGPLQDDSDALEVAAHRAGASRFIHYPEQHWSHVHVRW